MDDYDKAMEAVRIAIKALEYCAVDSRLLLPENNSQRAVAMNALGKIDALKLSLPPPPLK